MKPLFVNVLAYRLHDDPEHPLGYPDDDGQKDYWSRINTLVQAALMASPARIAEVKPRWLAALARYISNDTLVRQLSPPLQPLAAKSKPLRQALAAGLAQAEVLAHVSTADRLPEFRP